MEKICSKCRVSKPIELFYRQQGGKLDRRAECKACNSQWTKDWKREQAGGVRDSDAWHRLTEIDESTRLGTCSQCGPEIALKWNGGGVWQCGPDAKERSRRYTLQSLYKMTLEQFEEIVLRQEGKCKLCRRSDLALVIDHDHRCCPGKYTCGQCIRGVICNSCNGMIGHIEHNGIDLVGLTGYMEGRHE